jgi:hypothetical protein
MSFLHCTACKSPTASSFSEMFSLEIIILPLSHRVGRVLSFSPVVGIGTPPTPHPQASVSPPLVLGEEARLPAREGAGESQFRRGDIHCGTLYIIVLCALSTALVYQKP